MCWKNSNSVPFQGAGWLRKPGAESSGEESVGEGGDRRVDFTWGAAQRYRERLNRHVAVSNALGWRLRSPDIRVDQGSPPNSSRDAVGDYLEQVVGRLFVGPGSFVLAVRH